MIFSIKQKLEYIECLTENFIVSLNRNSETFEDYYVLHNKLSMESVQLNISPENDGFIPCIGEDSLIIARYSNELGNLDIRKLNLVTKESSSILTVSLDTGSTVPELMDVYMWSLDHNFIMIGYSQIDGHSIDNILLIDVSSGQHMCLPLSLASGSNWNNIIGVQKIHEIFVFEFLDSETTQYSSLAFELNHDAFSKNIDMHPIFHNRKCTHFIGRMNGTSILLNNEQTPSIEIVDHYTHQTKTKAVNQPEYFKTISNKLYSVHKTSNGFNLYTHSIESDEIKTLFIPISADHLDLLSFIDESPIFRVYNVSPENRQLENKVIKLTKNIPTIIGNNGFYDEKTDTLIIYS